MVQIWVTEPYPCGDPRLPHHIFPPKMITPDELTKRTGTLYWKVGKGLSVYRYRRKDTRNEVRVFPGWGRAQGMPKTFEFAIPSFQLDTLDQIALSKRITMLKLERKFAREDIYTLDAATTANFDDKVGSSLNQMPDHSLAFRFWHESLVQHSLARFYFRLIRPKF